MTSEAPYYARRNERGFYTWEGEELPSVTTILSLAPGQHLMSWYAKEAALKAASHLVQCGIVDPTNDPVLKEFCDNLVERDIPRTQAVAEIANWAVVMREAERYRDHKARIGSVTHHAIYEKALGLDVDWGDVEDYLRETAIRLNLWRESHGPEFRPTEQMIEAVAAAAKAYVRSAFEWIEVANPEWEMIGQEAAVFHPEDEDGVGYAGTVDCAFVLRKSTYGHEWIWPSGEYKVRMIADFKTSNALAEKSVQMQLEAYANASFIGMVQTGEKFDVPESDHIGALHIGPHPVEAGLRDEFGTLETKAARTGAKLFTWPRNDETYGAFRGLCKFYRWSMDVPRPQQRPKRTPSAPKPEKGAPRECPF